MSWSAGSSDGYSPCRPPLTGLPNTKAPAPCPVIGAAVVVPHAPPEFGEHHYHHVAVCIVLTQIVEEISERS